MTLEHVRPYRRIVPYPKNYSLGCNKLYVGRDDDIVEWPDWLSGLDPVFRPSWWWTCWPCQRCGTPGIVNFGFGCPSWADAFAWARDHARNVHGVKL